jgi:uncharacterized protein
MRVESTYNFPAPIERVFTAVTDPDVLRQIIPGCERLIQLGPSETDGTLTCEARVRVGPDQALYTVSGTIEPQRPPAHLTLNLRAQGPHGDVTLRGSLDLAPQDGRTVAAYVWDVDTRVPDGGEARAPDEAAAPRLAQEACERLETRLRAGDHGEVSLADALPVLRADTARGKIILLPPEPPPGPLRQRLRPALRGAAWAGAGLLAGLAAIAVAAAIIRRWGIGRDAGAHE